ncbi:MAG: hypothetical protein ACM3X7_08835 [Solirubrobacterales bacterium]
MNSVAFAISDFTSIYDSFNMFSRIRDRLKIHYDGEEYIKELDLNIFKVFLPPNINDRAYMNNIRKIEKHIGAGKTNFAPKTFRFLDFNVYSNFQKNLMGYSVVNSSKLILRANHKSIRESCIVLYDAAHFISKPIIDYLAREARYIILVSNNKAELKRLWEYISANFGISVITSIELDNAVKSADIIITTENIDVKDNTPVWYLNNLYRPQKMNNYKVNDISLKVPWSIYHNEMPLEIVGAVLSQMEEKDVEKSLSENDIFINNSIFEIGTHLHYN